jgi:hypothetical protein
MSSSFTEWLLFARKRVRIFPSVSRTDTLHAFLIASMMLHAPPISSSLIQHPGYIWFLNECIPMIKSTDFTPEAGTSKFRISLWNLRWLWRLLSSEMYRRVARCIVTKVSEGPNISIFMIEQSRSSTIKMAAVGSSETLVTIDVTTGREEKAAFFRVTIMFNTKCYGKACCSVIGWCNMLQVGKSRVRFLMR